MLMVEGHKKDIEHSNIVKYRIYIHYWHVLCEYRYVYLFIFVCRLLTLEKEVASSLTLMRSL